MSELASEYGVHPTKPSVDLAIVRHWFMSNGKGRSRTAQRKSLSGVAKNPLRSMRKRFRRCMQRLRGEPTNAMRSRERANAVANEPKVCAAIFCPKGSILGSARCGIIEKNHPSLTDLTDAHKTWGFGLCFLHLRNVKGHP